MDFPLYLHPKIYILHVIQISHVQKKNISLRCHDKLSIPEDASWTTEAEVEAATQCSCQCKCGVTALLTGQAVMFCFHWLMLELSSRVVHRRCRKSQPQ